MHAREHSPWAARHVVSPPCHPDWDESRGGCLLGSGTRPPTRLPTLRAHLVTKGQWLQAIRRVALKAPENFVPFAGDPENAGVRHHFRPLAGPQEGRGEVANFDFEVATFD